MAAKKAKKGAGKPRDMVYPYPVDWKLYNSKYQQKANAMTYAEESRKSNSPSASTRQRTGTRRFLQSQGPNPRPFYPNDVVEMIKEKGDRAGYALGKGLGKKLPKTKKGSPQRRAK